ncbi:MULTISPECIES: VOC family protein [Subtercola]|uniref:VOC family protein n=1 Tax=Subtercola vilae TaxID=2056433 RepID=A0A4T2BRH9_9MICO|nr:MULTISPECIES: VOC family protein [Subtercola]MEA9987109.1 VOC family protein [Subtercola sp. RTI3]TIH32126.1 VOC family protein [Subtercola vilae]
MNGSLNSTDLLAASTGMGPVTLRVGNLDAEIAYYRDGVTLDVLSHEGSIAVLGRGSTPVLILEHAPELANAAPRSAGLYHTAILFESREALAAAIYSVATTAPGTFTGSADHKVSIAFYFTDPEGNGVELYWDRSRTEWSWVHGQIEMATLYVDPNEFLQKYLTEETVQNPRLGGASVGHVHLSVGDIPSAKEFYVRRLGFETTFEIPGSALFISAGKYHHHMAMNTWQSAGAGRRQLALGLAQVDIVVPAVTDLGALEERLTHYATPFANDGRALVIEDPWGSRVTVSTEPLTPAA